MTIREDREAKEDKIAERLEEIRKSILAENVSYGEISELESYAKYILPEDGTGRNLDDQ